MIERHVEKEEMVGKEDVVDGLNLMQVKGEKKKREENKTREREESPLISRSSGVA